MSDWDDLIAKELPMLTEEVRAIGIALDASHKEMTSAQRAMTVTLLLIAKLRAEMKNR